MTKTNTFIIAIVSFLLIFNAIPSLAEVSNPFTAKGEDEFTPEDRKKMEESLKEDMNNKILALETKINLVIDNLKNSSVSRAPKSRRGGESSEFDTNDPDVFKNPGLFGDNFEESEEEEIIEEDPKITRVIKAKFVGCVDKKVLFKDNKTKENFFVTIEEAEENEEFNKMGSCSF